jgi:hypothetical protein
MIGKHPLAGEFGIGISQTGITRMEPGLPLGHYYGYKTDGNISDSIRNRCA